MILRELAVRGMPGLAAGRWAFAPGLNAVSGSAAATGGFVQALLSLLFQGDGWAAGGRAGLTFAGRDGGTYSLIAAAGSPPELRRLDGATGRFEPLAAGDGLSRPLALAGLPERGVFDSLFLFADPSVPRSDPPAPPAAGGGRIESRLDELAGGVAGTAQRSPADLRQRLAEAEAELPAALAAEESQARLDDLQQKLAPAEEAFQGIQRLRAELAQIDGELSRLPEIGPEIAAQIERLPQLAHKRDEALRRIADERRELEENARRVRRPIGRLTQDRLFLSGLLGGIGAVVLAAALTGRFPIWRYAALLDIPGFGLAALRASVWLSAAGRERAWERKRALLREGEARARQAFDGDVGQAAALMKALGLATSAELAERVTARNELLARRVGTEAALLAAEQDAAFQAAASQRAALRRQVADEEAKLAEAPPRSAGELQHEISELRAEIARQGAVAAGRAFAEGPFATDAAAELFRRAAEGFGVVLAELVAAVRDRGGRYVEALTGGRLGAPELLPDGTLALSSAGAPAAFARLEGSDRAACLLGLRLALAERWLASRRMFLVIDERATFPDEARRRLVARMAHGLAATAQVFWLGEAAASLASRTVALGS